MTYAILLLFAAAGLGLAAWLVYLESPAGAAWLRLRLAHRVAAERLGDMLLRRGIRPSEYVRVLPRGELGAQVAACRHCAEQPRCDYILASRPGSVVDLTFCPNNGAINRAVSMLRR